ncbi:hypothetical protein [Vallitalea okinawensis]|uniref:hypothetical protein n=1 Tax=Vallitalea okinawensis TaxID=2078660 RepID=UPI000CFD15BF|nr:hypothetical protein [Vallitalea okinawensis]
MKERILPWRILKQAIYIYKEKFTTLIVYSLLIFIVQFFLDGYSLLVNRLNIPTDNISYLIGKLILYIPYLYFTFLFSIALIILCSLYYEHRDMEWRTLIKMSKLKFWKYLLADLEILAYMILPLLGVFFAVLIFQNYFGIVIAILSFLIMIWLTLRMIFATYIAVLRKEKGSFVKTSMLLTRKEIKSVAIVYLLSSIIFHTPFVIIELGELFEVINGVTAQLWFMFSKQSILLLARPFTIASLTGLFISLNERLDEEKDLEIKSSCSWFAS